MTAVLLAEQPTAATVAVAAKPKLSWRYDSLDMWRGVACVMVVLYHSTLVFHSSAGQDANSAGLAAPILGWLHHGSLGVPLFFVISGYCIAAAARGAQEKNLPIGTYFWRRFRRIYPPYWIALVALVLLFVAIDWKVAPGIFSDQPWAQLRPWWFSPSQWLGNITLTESWRYHLGGSQRAHVIGQSWTLCYEEQFYFVMGLLLFLPRKWFFAGCGIVSMLCLACQQVACSCEVNVSGFFFDGHWFSFAFGILVFYALTCWKLAGQLTGALAVAVAGIALSQLPGLESHHLIVSGLFAALLVITKPLDALIVGVVWLRPLFWCGTMCYSLYLVHQLLVAGVSRGCYWAGLTTAEETLFITVPLCVVVSLVAGWAFYQFVERRFLNPATVVAQS